MKLITISGLDGSGKTTQLDLLEKKLQKDFVLKRFHMINFSIANKFLKKNKKLSHSKPKAKIEASPIAIFLRKIAIVIDVFRFRFFYLIKNSENKLNYLLVDRYFYDQIINIKYLDKKRDWKKEPFWQKIVENQLIQPTLKIYLKIDPEEIIKRNQKIEQGQEYLLKKKDLYEHFYKQWKMTKIKGDVYRKEIQQKINQLL